MFFFLFCNIFPMRYLFFLVKRYHCLSFFLFLSLLSVCLSIYLAIYLNVCILGINGSKNGSKKGRKQRNNCLSLVLQNEKPLRMCGKRVWVGVVVCVKDWIDGFVESLHFSGFFFIQQFNNIPEVIKVSQKCSSSNFNIHSFNSKEISLYKRLTTSDGRYFHLNLSLCGLSSC